MRAAALVAAVLALTTAAIAAPSPARTLAAAAVAEAGWTSARDHAAMWHVFARRARSQQRDIADVARAYCAAWRVLTPRTFWVRGLENVDVDAPPGWPAGVRWAPHREAFERVELAAERFLEGAVADPCGDCEPDHFGGPMDHLRAERAGWRECDCGDTAQRYWRSR